MLLPTLVDGLNYTCNLEFLERILFPASISSITLETALHQFELMHVQLRYFHASRTHSSVAPSLQFLVIEPEYHFKHKASRPTN